MMEKFSFPFIIILNINKIWEKENPIKALKLQHIRKGKFKVDLKLKIQNSTLKRFVVIRKAGFLIDG
jgi:hypothetical protein